jgi:hypothetical protein
LGERFVISPAAELEQSLHHYLDNETQDFAPFASFVSAIRAGPLKNLPGGSSA